MKCDELKRHHINEVMDMHNLTRGEMGYSVVYYADDVDKAIAELKDQVKFCSDYELAARKDIKEMRGQYQMLKQFGHYKLSPVPGHMINHEMRQYVSYNVVCMIINHLESETKKLKAEIESLKASHYAESVDAGMRERRLRRALWLARAERADDKARIFYFAETCGVKLNIDGYSNKEKGHTRMCTARDWRITWLKVERKCRAKAEGYK